jgi:hypothetical protein
MLQLKKELWETNKILKIKAHGNWNNPDVQQVTYNSLDEIESLLDECIEQELKCIWIIDCVKGDVPPFYYLGIMALRLVSLKEKLIKSLHFTLLYSINDSHETILNSLLAIYTPARPIHIVKSKEEIKNYVDSVPKK